PAAISPTATMNNAAFQYFLPVETLSIMRSIMGRWPARASRRRRRAKNTAYATTSAGTASSHHRWEANSHRMSGELPEAGQAERRLQQRQQERRPQEARKHLGMHGAAVAQLGLVQLLEDLVKATLQRHPVGGQIGRAAGHRRNLLEQLGVDRIATLRHA